MFKDFFKRIKNGFFSIKTALSYANTHKAIWKLAVIKITLYCAAAIAFFIILPRCWYIMLNKYIYKHAGFIFGSNEMILISVIFVLFVFLMSIFAIFFDLTATHYLLETFEGRSVTLSRSARVACSHWFKAVQFALIDVILSILRTKNNNGSRLSRLFGSFITGLAGLAWTVATFFIAPVIITEKGSLIENVKKSAQTMQNTFGEVTGFKLGIFILGFILLIPLLLVVLICAMIKYLHILIYRSMVGFIVLILLFVLFVFIFVTTLLKTISTWIFTCAAYNYTQSKSSGPLDKHFITQAIIIKNRDNWQS